MIFVLSFLTLLGLTGWMIFVGLFFPLSISHPWIFQFHVLAYIFAFFSFGFVISGRIRSNRSELAWRMWIGAFFFSFLGMHSLFFVASIFSMAIALLSSLPVNEVALASLSCAYLLAAMGIFVAWLGPQIIEVDLLREGLDPPLKIIQISDLHIGASVGHKYVKRLMDLVEMEKPDCIVLTGDIGDGEPSRHAKSIQELARLNAPLGVFAVLGNHEMYWPTNEWIHSFRSLGIQVLIDEVVQIPWGKNEVSIVGLAPFEKKTLIEIHSEIKNEFIVLSHYPHRAQEAAAHGARLFLAGHTHGGQFWPWSWFIHLFHRYARGHYILEKTNIYVNSGTGHWGPPFRFGRRAEITKINLSIGSIADKN